MTNPFNGSKVVLSDEAISTICIAVDEPYREVCTMLNQYSARMQRIIYLGAVQKVKEVNHGQIH